MISKLFTQFIKHKIAASLILAVAAGAGYWGYGKIFSNDGAIRYATAQVQKGTIIVSISGSGQVSASNQVDVKPKTSGDIVWVSVKQSQEVGAGALIAQLDMADAERAVRDAETALKTALYDWENDAPRAVRDAETALETAKLELDKMLEPVDTLTLLQSEHSLLSAKESKQKSEDNIVKAYEDGFNTVANAFLALPNVMTGLQDMLFSGSLGGGGQWNIDFYANMVQDYDDSVVLRFKDDVYVKYRAAREVYDKNFEEYKSASRFSDQATIDALINQTYDTTKLIAEAIKSTTDLIQFYQDKLTERSLKPIAGSDAHLSSLNSYTGSTNSHLINLLSIQRSLKDSREAIVSAERTIQERELSHEKLKNGPDELDIRAKKITIQQKEDALLTAQQNVKAKEITVKQNKDALTTAKQALADRYIRAPFAGVIAKVNAKKGDSASAGTAIATLVTKQKIAEVSLNEVDVAKVKAEQKVTLTFDAVPDLTITGQVAEVDAVGTVSQGVVTYTVKIGFDTQDDRVKTAMSVSAAIVTEAKPNALLVPNSAVKSQGGISYVELPNEADLSVATTNVNGAVFRNPTRQQQIEIGLSNDEFTEIIGGLQQGDVVVTRIIQPTAQTTQTQQNSSLRIPGLNTGGGGGGGFRPR